VLDYELIVASASRPHLLERTLSTLIDIGKIPSPARAILHDDGRWAGQAGRVGDALMTFAGRVGPVDGKTVPFVYRHDSPPIRHGPALAWLLSQVKADFVLYSQDDHEVLRDLPIKEALRVMRDNPDINQIRFNKRATMAFKETWQGRWYKRELIEVGGRTLTISDHWYFQTGLWRTDFIRRAVEYCSVYPQFVESVEQTVNNYLDSYYCNNPRDPDERVGPESPGTLIWGPIGEDQFVKHIGDKPEDWAGDHPRE
jgi:hypothetical protein